MCCLHDKAIKRFVHKLPLSDLDMNNQHVQFLAILKSGRSQFVDERVNLIYHHSQITTKLQQ